TNWKQIKSASSPSARHHHAMAYDSARQRTILFGGITGSDETWEYIPPTPPISIFPKTHAKVEGNAAHATLLSSPRSRTQLLMSPGGFSNPMPSVTALELRRDQGTSALVARKLGMRVLVGRAKTNAKTMSTNFLANWQAGASVAFSGTLNVPTQMPAPKGPAPFGIRIPFAQAHAWTSGDLLVEFEVASNSVTSSPFPLDAVEQAFPRGSVSMIGKACKSPTGNTPRHIVPKPANLLPGGVIDSSIEKATPTAPAMNVLGTTSLSPPFRLWPGTSCFIYTNFVANATAAVSAAGVAKLRYPIPNNAKLSGGSFYSQWFVYEGPMRFPMITTTEAAKLTIGFVRPVYFDMIQNTDLSYNGTKAKGVYRTLVVRLR
ncbi:MAG: hypothetical protein QF412_14850, partial [Planctomycetota bacterium]|nr:hypothetical protein [Planctomycetota bacterium]